MISRSVPSPDDASGASASDPRPADDPVEGDPAAPAQKTQSSTQWADPRGTGPFDTSGPYEASPYGPLRTAVQQEDDVRSARSTRSEDQLRSILGLDPVGWVLPVSVRLNGWIVTAVTGVIAVLTRFIGLGHPHSLMFDEIYYVKDAYALWHNGYESTWSKDSDPLFAHGDFSGLTSEPSFVVHPQLGKWIIGAGMELFGADSSFGWRFMPALAGVATVVLLTRLTMRLTRSPLLAGLAGLLLAIDGTAITESRIGLLDIFIGFFATLTVYFVVRDREWSRARLARDLSGTAIGHLAPRAHLRPWLLAAGIAAGLTCSIKWSGLYLLAAVGVLVVVWDTLALQRVEARAWLLEGLIARSFGDFLRLVPTALVVYVAGWWSWFLHADAYKHGWAASERLTNGTVTRSWLPDSLNDLLEYHQVAYGFHVKLNSPHQYMSKPIGWLVQWRPTSFYWPSAEELGGRDCGSDRCVAAITSIGNIPIWWSALVALVFAVAVLAVKNRDWRVWVALVGYAGLYLPWFLYGKRTIFTFYTVAFVPFVVLVLVLSLGSAMGALAPVPGSREAEYEDRMLRLGYLGEDRPHPRGALAAYLGFGTQPTRLRLSQEWTGVPAWRLHVEGVVLTACVVLASVVFAILWWPIWTGEPVPYDFWRWHMILPSWI